MKQCQKLLFCDTCYNKSMHYNIVQYHISGQSSPQDLSISLSQSLSNRYTHWHPNYSAALLAKNLIQQTGVSFTRSNHLGPGWQIPCQDFDCRPNEYNRCNRADSADVNKGNNKDIGSLVHSVRASIYLATACLTTAWKYKSKANIFHAMKCQARHVLRAIWVIVGGWWKYKGAFNNHISVSHRKTVKPWWRGGVVSS